MAVVLQNVACEKPASMIGDLHVTHRGVTYLTFQRTNPWLFALQLNLGLFGHLWIRQRRKRQEADSVAWRSGHGARAPEELARSTPDSWTVPKEEMEYLRKGPFGIGLTVGRRDRKVFSVTLNREQAQQVWDFASMSGWPVR